MSESTFDCNALPTVCWKDTQCATWRHLRIVPFRSNDQIDKKENIGKISVFFFSCQVEREKKNFFFFF